MSATGKSFACESSTVFCRAKGRDRRGRYATVVGLEPHVDGVGESSPAPGRLGRGVPAILASARQ